MTDAEPEPKIAEVTLPEKFDEFVRDFIADLTATFPEHAQLWQKWSSPTDADLRELFAYFLSVFPERFFDIIYQSDDLFKPESTTNTKFLPDVDFKILYNSEGVSETTKKSLWKYLQLILFSAINSVKDKTGFGDAMNMFSGVDETELHEKLQETMKGVESFFKSMSGGGGGGDDTETGDTDSDGYTHVGPDGENVPTGSRCGAGTSSGGGGTFDFKGMNMPKPEELHEHLRGLFDGKIGKLAKEMAEEISHDISDLGIGGENGSADTPENAQKVLQKLMKNPEKMMGIVKKVGEKLNDKMKSGEITQEEIMKEAGDLMGKMKDMSGGADIGEMMKKMARQMAGAGAGGAAAGGMPDAAQLAEMMAKLGKGARIDQNAMNNQAKKQTMRERMKAKLEVKRQQAIAVAAANAAAAPPSSSAVSAAYLDGNVFKIAGETQQKSAAPPQAATENLDELVAKLGFDKSDVAAAAAAGGTSKTQQKKKKGGKK